MKRFAAIAAFLAFAVFSIAAEPSAASLLKGATTQAKKEHKNVLVIFHASWCGWCHRLDETFLADRVMSKLVTDNFVVLHIDVLENGPKKSLENGGGIDLMKQWHGEKSGLPFMVVLNAAGQKLADSNLSGDESTNIGYPAKPEEIAHFLKMLKTAPRFSDSQATQVQAWLTEHAPKG